MKAVIVLLLLSLLPIGHAAAAATSWEIAASTNTTTYEALLAAKTCKDWQNTISCSYKIDKYFSMEIAGVGQPNAAVIFYKSDFDGTYYGKFGILHGCAIIANSSLIGDMAFISPKNGKVYGNWRDCATAM